MNGLLAGAAAFRADLVGGNAAKVVAAVDARHIGGQPPVRVHTMAALHKASSYAERLELQATAAQVMDETADDVTKRYTSLGGMVRLVTASPWQRLQIRSRILFHRFTLVAMPRLTFERKPVLTAIMWRRLAITSLALAAFHDEAGSYPAALDDLVPKYLPEVPTDLFTDQPVIYRQTDGGYLLYSAGINARDDGGATASPADDLAVRMDASGSTATSGPDNSGDGTNNR